MPSPTDPVFQKPAEPHGAEPYDPRGRLDPAGFARNAQFRTVAAPPDLTPFVEHFWIVRWHDIEGVYDNAEVMHRPYVDLFVAADSAGIQGTFRGKRVYRAEGTGRVMGARLLPGAFRCFWAGELSNLQDQVLPLDTAFPAAGPAFHTQIAADDDEAVAQVTDLLRSANPAPDDNVALINAIIAAIETDPDLTTVNAVATAFNRSERWVQQLTRDYLGIGLKWLLQRHRLLAAAASIRTTDNPDWADIAYALGYSSQQHFITDFRTVLGETPVQYKANLTG
jgi:AraC-like DNA-binding protein